MDNYNQNFSNYTVIDSQPAAESGVAKKFMANVFMWMFVALGVSTALAVLYGTNASLTEDLYVLTDRGLRFAPLGWVVALAPFGFVLIMTLGARKLSATALTFLFLAFAAVMGISLSYILWIYAPQSIIGCFGAAAAMFGVMAYMGYTTDKDLTSFGSILMMGLIGIIVASFINIFLGSPMMGYVISIIGVAVFTGLTAYDVQKLKRIGAGLEYETTPGDTRKLAILGALDLYLDFINLFLMLLRLFGSRK